MIIDGVAQGRSGARRQGWRSRWAGALCAGMAWLAGWVAQPAWARADAPPLPPWRPGMLDIHHISTGRGNAAFCVFPDGTTLLIDAGALSDGWADEHRPLVLAPRRPDASRRPGQWIADYIAQFAPSGTRWLDYALITHFHSDHFGEVNSGSPKSAKGDWRLSGLTDVAEVWPIATLIDRAGPDYAFPAPLRPRADASLANYFAFRDGAVARQGLKAEGFVVGSRDQIRLVRAPKAYPTFSVRNIAAGGRIADADGGSRQVLDPANLIDAKGGVMENPLSIVFEISYGAFTYVTGGDLTGISEPDQPEWFNMESQVAKVLSPADVITLNHHGNRDATNADWLRALRPRVLVEQTWTSDQPGGEVVARVASRKIWPDDRDVFATAIQPGTLQAIGPVLARTYRSMEGHVVVRVEDGGARYWLYVLDDRSLERRAVARFGPYVSRGGGAPASLSQGRGGLVNRKAMGLNALVAGSPRR